MSEQNELTEKDLLRKIVTNTYNIGKNTERTAKNVAFFFWIMFISCILGFLSAVPAILELVN